MSTLRATALPSDDRSLPRLRIADLFSGCGGLSIGLQRAAYDLGYSLDVRFALDADPIAINVYQKVFPTATTICRSIEEILGEEPHSPTNAAEAELKVIAGKLDIMLGGPPCQGYSNLNNHSRHDDPRNGLYLNIARAAEVLEPSAIVVENVSTVTHDVRQSVQRTVDQLRDIGYSIGQKKIDLSTLGVPQTRHRHVLIGIRHPNMNIQQHFNDGLRSPICEHVPRSVRWAIEDLEDIQSSRLFDSPSQVYPESQSRINWLFDNNEINLPSELRPPCHRSNHNYPSMYGRMSWDRPAQTVTTGFNCMGQGRYVHPSRRRVITPHEAARLQMLPDFVDFSSVLARKNLAKLIGNSAPPPLSFAIGKMIIPLLESLPPLAMMRR